MRSAAFNRAFSALAADASDRKRAAAPESSLADRMRARGDATLDALADKLDEATRGFYGDPQTHNVAQFVGAWARARRAWCDATGEPLI